MVAVLLLRRAGALSCPCSLRFEPSVRRVHRRSQRSCRSCVRVARSALRRRCTGRFCRTCVRLGCGDLVCWRGASSPRWRVGAGIRAVEAVSCSAAPVRAVAIALGFEPSVDGRPVLSGPVRSCVRVRCAPSLYWVVLLHLCPGCSVVARGTGVVCWHRSVARSACRSRYWAGGGRFAAAPRRCAELSVLAPVRALGSRCAPPFSAVLSFLRSSRPICFTPPLYWGGSVAPVSGSVAETWCAGGAHWLLSSPRWRVGAGIRAGRGRFPPPRRRAAAPPRRRAAAPPRRRAGAVALAARIESPSCAAWPAALARIHWCRCWRGTPRPVPSPGGPGSRPRRVESSHSRRWCRFCCCAAPAR